MSRRYSIDILFFCKGYSSGGHSPKTSSFSSVTSTAWPEAGEGTKIPWARTDAPVLSFLRDSSILDASALAEGFERSKVS